MRDLGRITGCANQERCVRLKSAPGARREESGHLAEKSSYDRESVPALDSANILRDGLRGQLHHGSGSQADSLRSCTSRSFNLDDIINSGAELHATGL